MFSKDPLNTGCQRCETRFVEDAITKGHSVTFHLANKCIRAL